MRSDARKPVGSVSSPVTPRGAPGPTQGAAETATGRFVRLPRDVLRRTDLTAIDKIVFAELVNLMGDKGACWPGQRHVARECGISLKAINRAIHRLQEAGLIDVERRGGLKGPPEGRTCRYRRSPRDNVQRSPRDNVQRSPRDNVPPETTLSFRRRQRSLSVHPDVVPETTEEIKVRDQEKRLTTAHAEKPSSKPRARDSIWDSVCELFSLKPITKADRTRIGRIVADLKLKSATAGEIRVRLERYRREWPRAADTPEALVKHWDRFGQDKPGQANPARVRTGSSEYEKCVERI